MKPCLSLLTLGVADLASARRFYEALGFVASSASAEGVAFYPAGGTVLALYGRADLARDIGLADGEGGGFAGITLAHNVEAEADVAAVLHEAESAGGRILKGAHKAFWGGTIGFFADPDGHIWEVAHNPGFKLDPHGRIQLPPPEAS